MNGEHRIAGLNLPHSHADDRCHRILDAALQGRSQTCRQPALQHWQGWDAGFFNLDQVRLFQGFRHTEQAQILQLANQGLLTEAYFIEKAGVGYMAKMVLLAETTEERMLYGLFTADETTHLSQLCPLLPALPPVGTDDPFLRLLADVVESSDKAVLLFVIQVVLEGWGLTHYRRLAQGCRDRTLAALFSSFLHAEARHHGTGLTLWQQTSLLPSSQATLIEVLASFLQLVQVGPQQVLAAIAQVQGPLSRAQQIQILEELGTETHSGTRLHLLRSLMQSGQTGAIIQALEERDLFAPLPAYRCV
jgi:hypothetical protein